MCACKIPKSHFALLESVHKSQTDLYYIYQNFVSLHVCQIKYDIHHCVITCRVEIVHPEGLNLQNTAIYRAGFVLQHKHVPVSHLLCRNSVPWGGAKPLKHANLQVSLTKYKQTLIPPPRSDTDRYLRMLLTSCTAHEQMVQMQGEHWESHQKWGRQLRGLVLPNRNCRIIVLFIVYIVCSVLYAEVVSPIGVCWAEDDKKWFGCNNWDVLIPQG